MTNDIQENNQNTKLFYLENQFIDFIRDRLAIVISKHQKKQLYKTIKEACLTFNCSAEDYLNLLKNSQTTSSYMDHLISGITVGETYFFRDKHQMHLIEHVVLPDLIQHKSKTGQFTLRIWSAGSATGEEIYTIAILLNELISDIKKWNIQLLATDINTSALHKARLGQYNEWSMRSISKAYKEKYFIKENNKYLLQQFIRERVQFEYLNLHDDTFPSILNATNAQDLIICRNVFIYFDMNYIKELMKKFNTCLLPDGFLLLGASDPIIIKDTDFSYYHKESTLLKRASTKVEDEKPIALPSPSLLIDTSTTRPLPHFINNKAIDASRKIKDKIDIEFIQSLTSEKKWNEIVDLTKNIDPHNIQSVPLLNYLVTAYANVGLLEKAQNYCMISLELDSINIETHFALAMIFLELNLLNEAEKEFRKVIYLDRDFVNSHFQLGLLLIRMKQTNAGIKSLQNALKIAKNKDPMQLVPGEAHLTYQRLAEILAREIDIYK